MPTDLKLFGDLEFGVIPGAEEGARFLQIRLGQRLGPAANTSAPARRLEAGANMLAQDIALEFRKSGEDMERQLAAWRRRIDVLRQGMQLDAALV